MVGGVAWGVQEIEGSVVEVIHGWEAADAETIAVEGGFVDGAVGGVGVEDRGGRVAWVAARLMEGFFESGPDDQWSRGGEGRWVTDVVEVVVGPDYGGDVVASDV